MKSLRNILMGAAILIAGACEEGIDPISSVDAGPDESAPAVTIKQPAVQTVIIPFTDEATDMTFEVEAVDDIEVKSVSVKLNGSEMSTTSKSKDYRKAVQAFTYEDLPLGDHVLQVTATDASGKSTTVDYTVTITNQYQVKYDGETLYMPFEGAVFRNLITDEAAGVVGTPGFATGKHGDAYSGSTDEYLTLPIDGLVGADEFSATFWYKVNATPNRSGILTVSAPDLNNPSAPNNRVYGFRLFREDAAGKQRIKLNVGNGTGDNWFDGGAAADVDPATNQWVHIAITIAADKAVVYINGNVVSQGTFAGIDWTGAESFSIGSGAPNFVEWGHLSDHSLYDELRFFNKALTEAQVEEIMTNN